MRLRPAPNFARPALIVQSSASLCRMARRRRTWARWWQQALRMQAAVASPRCAPPPVGSRPEGPTSPSAGSGSAPPAARSPAVAASPSLTPCMPMLRLMGCTAVTRSSHRVVCHTLQPFAAASRKHVMYLSRQFNARIESGIVCQIIITSSNVHVIASSYQ